MRLNHINLPVADVASSRDFFARYFGMEAGLERGRGALAIMKDEGGMVLMWGRFDKAAREVHYHEDFHVGFFLDTREEVDGIHARMIADGLEADTPRKMPGRHAFYLKAPGGFVTEVASIEGIAGAP